MRLDAEARAELERRNIPWVPATLRGERHVHGWNPAALAELVGVPYDDTPALVPAELVERLDTVLYHTQHLVKGLSSAALALNHPGRDRDLADLVFHIYRVGRSFPDCLDQGQFPHAWLEATPSAEDRNGLSLFRTGEETRQHLTQWFSKSSSEVYEQPANTYYGEQRAFELLERTTWHAGQHLRQIHDLLEQDGQLQPGSLPMELFESLPMPEAIW